MGVRSASVRLTMEKGSSKGPSATGKTHYIQWKAHIYANWKCRRRPARSSSPLRFNNSPAQNQTAQQVLSILSTEVTKQIVVLIESVIYNFQRRKAEPETLYKYNQYTNEKLSHMSVPPFIQCLILKRSRILKFCTNRRNFHFLYS